ncbi:hypothetical protein HDV05_002146, partial [Chytridiales sp. JEL 0842]
MPAIDNNETTINEMTIQQQQDQQQQEEQQWVLVTGGAGYIGSHTVLELLQAGYKVVVVDNLSNSSTESLRRVLQITKKPKSDLVFYNADITNQPQLLAIFQSHPQIKSVIHFAGLKSVSESVSQPLRYYNVNVQGTLILLECMKACGVKDIVFSSSATVYGDPRTVPILESHPLGPQLNPYGRSKYMAERIIEDFCLTNTDMNAALLRYFNPIGAHETGMIGEDPSGVPNNLLPYVTQVLCGRLPFLNVFGDDYDTKDGSGVRDFIHVVDLAL